MIIRATKLLKRRGRHETLQVNQHATMCTPLSLTEKTNRFNLGFHSRLNSFDEAFDFCRPSSLKPHTTTGKTNAAHLHVLEGSHSAHTVTSPSLAPGRAPFARLRITIRKVIRATAVLLYKYVLSHAVVLLLPNVDVRLESWIFCRNLLEAWRRK